MVGESMKKKKVKSKKLKKDSHRRRRGRHPETENNYTSYIKKEA
jgi:hypothetical protein